MQMYLGALCVHFFAILAFTIWLSLESPVTSSPEASRTESKHPVSANSGTNSKGFVDRRLNRFHRNLS